MARLKNTCELYSDENPDPNFFMKLKISFRCHADILSIPNELFYNGELEVGIRWITFYEAFLS